MSRSSKKKAQLEKAPVPPSGGLVSPAGEMPGVADSRSPEPKSRSSGLNDRWTVLGVCIFLAAVTFAVFGQTLGHEFVNYDDEDYVYENPTVTRGLTLQGIVWAFTHFYSSNWHPLTWISHMLDCQLYGLNPGGHHLTNVLCHTATAILLFLALRQMTGALWRSAFVAAVFAVHPLRVESVAWVSERKDVLSGVFFMLTIMAYVRYARRPWAAARYGLVVLLFALGLMCKPMLVTLPLVLLLLDYWPLNRVATVSDQRNHFQIPRRLILEKLPLFVLAAASCVVTLFAQTEAMQPLPLPLRAGNASISYVAYLGQMFWPSHLAVLYPFPAGGVGVWRVVLSLVVLAGISAGVFVLRRYRPYLLTGWLWYLIMLVPVIGILQVGLQAQADRYTYLPQIGLYLMVTWAAADLGAGLRNRRWVLGGLSTVTLMALIFCARAQTAYWQNSELLWTHTLACTSDNGLAYSSLGNVLLHKGKVDEAIVHLQKALQINPVNAGAHIDLGNALLKKGRVDEAIAHYQKSLEINPDYAGAHINLGSALLKKGRVDEAISHFQKALQINPDDAKAHNNLGNALLKKGRVDEAIAHFQKALQINPDNAEIHNNLGNALLKKSKVDEAMVHYQTALQIRPDYAEAHYDLGNVLLQKGSADEAMIHFQRALQIEPDNPEAHYNLGNALFTKGDVDEAIAHFQRALQINPNFAEAHINLGSTLFQKGKVDEAIAHYQKALQINPDLAEALNNLAWVLATCPQALLRNGNQAVALAQRAHQLTGDGNPVVLDTLAAAYAEAGRFTEAVETAQRALQVAETQSNPTLADTLRSQLKLYQAGMPYHLH